MLETNNCAWNHINSLSLDPINLDVSVNKIINLFPQLVRDLMTWQRVQTCINDRSDLLQSKSFISNIRPSILVVFLDEIR